VANTMYLLSLLMGRLDINISISFKLFYFKTKELNISLWYVSVFCYVLYILASVPFSFFFFFFFFDIENLISIKV
jgi:hypothetical protein